jgi:hypothetical protein
MPLHVGRQIRHKRKKKRHGDDNNTDQNRFQKPNQISSIGKEIRGEIEEKPAKLGGREPISPENNNWAATNLGAPAGA